jgi:DNA-directed RNA polymerase subunit RPC12/RpoP
LSELIQYKCPCCGAPIAFDAKTQKVKCANCGNEYEMETLKNYDEANKPAQDKMEWKDVKRPDIDPETVGEMKTYSCQSCGAQIVTDAATAASSCPYCGNPIVMAENVSGMMRPDMIIPFKLDKKAAKQALLEHYKGKPLLPKIFKTQNHLDEIKGIYVPFWLYDCDANANINYAATRSRHYSDSNYDYTETSHYLLHRAGNIGFDKVPVDGSKQLDDTLTEAIEPFDYSTGVDFQTAYLAGYLADRYDVDSTQSNARANQRVKTSTELAFAATCIGYESVLPTNSSIVLKNGAIHYALLPVWILNTTFKGKKYVFAMNGQSGKFIGDLPIDKGKWFTYFFAVVVGVAAIIMLILKLIGKI